MRKVKLIVHEKYAGKQSPGVMRSTDKSQDSLCSRKGVLDGTSEA